jgi:hypothetical protein
MTYELTVKNAAGETKVCPATVTVKTTPPTGKPECTLTVTPNSLAYPGDKATLAWTTKNAVKAVLSGGGGEVALNGSFYVFPAQSLTYGMTVYGSDGQVGECSTSVTVGTKPKPQMICTLPSGLYLSDAQKATLAGSLSASFKAFLDGLQNGGWVDPNVILKDQW